MAVIWGLDLHEMQWSKFKNSYMWNNEFHLRRTKFVVYQLAMIFCVISESFGTKALDDYVHQQGHIQKLAAELGRDTSIYNNDFVATESFNIFTGVYVATIFGSAFFFDLFWPRRHESKAVKLAWKICSILACCFALASAITISVIFSTRRAYVTGDNPDPTELDRILDNYKHGGSGSLLYRNNPYFIVSLAFIWPGFLATVASTVVMWMSLSHNDKFGPKSTHARKADGTDLDVDTPRNEIDESKVVAAPPSTGNVTAAPGAAQVHSALWTQPQSVDTNDPQTQSAPSGSTLPPDPPSTAATHTQPSEIPAR